MMAQRFMAHSLLFDPQLMANIRILIVGVGGIGCQLLKVLSKSPINSIHIIDMDTIQLSNLNRQFLFKAQHKGKSKSLTAKQSIKKLNPYLSIEAHHKNIKELPITFFQQFSFLIMALDNIQARNYVNKIGIRLRIPIIDAGTLAYKGNARIIVPHVTACYACQPKSSSQKSYPVCTIRMKPEKPIHCVVWGKMLFQVFFGQNTASDKMQDKQKEEGDMDDLSELIKKDISEVFLQLFCTEIQTIKNAKTQSDTALSQMYMKKIRPIDTSLIHSCISENSNSTIEQFQQFDDKLQIHNHLLLAKQSYLRLLDQKKREGFILFQKDDDVIMHFICAVANIRMHCFTIQDGNLSFNQIKNMAGNIVPAIASTNSIVSGLQVLQMMKYVVYCGATQSLKSYYIQNQSYKIRGMNIQPPNKQCLVCSNEAAPAIIQTNFKTYKFNELLQTLQQYLNNIQQYSINLGSRQLFNSEEDTNEIILKKTLLEICCNIHNSNSQFAYQMQLIVTDEGRSQKVCSVWVLHSQQLLIVDSNQNAVRIINQKPLFRRPSHNPIAAEQEQKMVNQAGNQNNDDDLVQLVNQQQMNNQVDADDQLIQIIMPDHNNNKNTQMIDQKRNQKDPHVKNDDVMIDQCEQVVDVVKKRRKIQ